MRKNYINCAFAGVVFLCLNGLSAAVDIIWTDQGSDQILRGAADGSGSASLLFDNSDYPGSPSSISPRGVAVEGSFAYWSDGFDKLLRGSTDGSGSASLLFDISDYPGSPIAAGPFGVAADGGFMYWADLIGDIFRGAADGSGSVTSLFDSSDYPGSPGSIGPYGLATDGDFLYWSDVSTDEILRGAIDGSGSVTSLFDSSDYPGSPGSIFPRSVVVDGAFVYWADSDTGEVLRGAIDGSGSVTSLFDSSDYPGSPGSVFPVGVAVDGGFVYWTDSTTGQILSGAADGSGSPSLLFDISDYPGSPGSINPFFITIVPEPSSALMLLMAFGGLLMLRVRKQAALVLVVACGISVHTQTLDAQVTFDWATVGNPGNSADSFGFGAVDYDYRISKHEVTNAQYTNFLNAVADTDTHGLYNPVMDSDARGGITQSGVSGSFSYAVKPGRANNPVVLVSFFDAMRFVNWLENGQPSEVLQGPGTTEDGVYTLGCAPAGACETRAASASFFIPSHDEWRKAAYHKNDGVTGNYFNHATSTDATPTSEPPSGGANSANYREDGTGNYALTGTSAFDNGQNYLADVGSYAQSVSPYGTFDQAGNVWEWTERIRTSDNSRYRIGGSWSAASSLLLASTTYAGDTEPPSNENLSTGFRVASIPEPSSGLMLLMAFGGLLMLRVRS